MSRWNLIWLISIPATFLAFLTLSYSAPAERDKDYQLLRTVVDVMAEVDNRYVRKLDDNAKQKFVEDMINGGLEKLDPYSSYMNADEYRYFDTQTEGNFGGIGISLGGIEPKTGYLLVTSPMVGTPAYDAGVLAGDLIVKIDDHNTRDMKVTDVVKWIQGEPGTPLQLTVIHEGDKEPVVLNMKRALIEVQTVMGFQRSATEPKEWDFMIDPKNGIAYIRLVQFSEHSASDFRKAVEKVQALGAKGLILDLRDNPGGLLNSAVEISDMFLLEGKIVSTRDRNDRGRVFEAKAANTLFEPAKDHPIMVLINKNSASASEIVAAALQDHHRAIIVGDRSFGKGSVQKVIKLSSDPPTALKLTTDSYWRPSGQNIHRHKDSKESDEWGVKPDTGFEVILKEDEYIEYLKHRRERDIIRTKPRLKKANEKPFQDRALNRAVEHLQKEISPMSSKPFIDLTEDIKS